VHLRGQELVIGVAAPGGWTARPEAAVSVGGPRPHSIDLLLARMAAREIGVVEVWDLLDDVGSALRSLDAKRAAIEDRFPDWAVGALWIVRGTRRNRRLVTDHPRVFAARFKAPSGAWLRALEDRSAPMPPEAGLLWTHVAGSRVIPWRPGWREPRRG
jgi:hypothetical protein